MLKLFFWFVFGKKKISLLLWWCLFGPAMLLSRCRPALPHSSACWSSQRCHCCCSPVPLVGAMRVSLRGVTYTVSTPWQKCSLWNSNTDSLLAEITAVLTFKMHHATLHWLTIIEYYYDVITCEGEITLMLSSVVPLTSLRVQIKLCQAV